MQSIEGPDRFHLLAAEGWLDLGSGVEAAAEWGRLSETVRSHPAAIEVRWRIEARSGRWQEALASAEQLLRLSDDHPVAWIHRSYALHELSRTREAYDHLEPAAARFPEETTIPYNLACYACRMGQLETARQWLAEASRRKSRRAIQQIALADADLEPLWPEIAGW